MKRQLVLLVAFAATDAAAQPAPAWRAAESTITVADLKRDVAWLADDARHGRETLEPGATAAADYVAQRFAELGLEKLPGQSAYRVAYALDQVGWDAAATHFQLTRGRKTEKLRAGVDFAPLQPTDEKQIEGKVVFAGYGLSLPEKGWDDYAGLDVKGKIVLVLRHVPNEKNPKSKLQLPTAGGAFVAKAMAALNHGAIGMIVVTEPSHEYDETLSLAGGLEVPEPPPPPGHPPASQPGRDKGKPFVSVMASRATAEKLVAGSGLTLAELQSAVDGGVKPAELALAPIRAQIAVKEAATPKRVTADNVVAFLPGSDPARRDEWIVVGGHYDHVGENGLDGDRIHNGADDNASGTSAVLALARAYASLPASARPARSIVFIAFSGEEKGLLGSDAILAQHQIPVERVVFMLNLDMIGRNPQKPVDILGDAHATELRTVADGENGDLGVSLRWSGKSYAGNSDHHSFWKRSVPSMFIFTGLHEDYHQPGDHADKLAYDRMEKLTRLSFRIVGRLAQGDVTPEYVLQLGWLGVAIRYDAAHGRRAVVAEVEPGSRAANAGMAVGDVVVAVGEKQPADPRAVGEAFDEVKPGTRTKLALSRGGTQTVVEVERSQRGYMGVFLDDVPEEQRKALGLGPDDGFLVRQAMPEGPAAKAGLREGDIVISLNGNTVNEQTLGQLNERLGAGEKVTVVFARGGERQTVQMVLGVRPKRRN